MTLFSLDLYKCVGIIFFFKKAYSIKEVTMLESMNLSVAFIKSQKECHFLKRLEDCHFLKYQKMAWTYPFYLQNP